MKRIVNVLSIVGFVFGLILLASIYFLTIPAPAVLEGESVGSLAFVSFPVDQPRLVAFDIDAEDSGLQTNREQRDQVLDWLLFTVLSDAGLSVEQFNEITFDLPPRRYGYLHSVANFEYGLTRSRFIGDGKVVALIPAASTADERIDYLTHVFDEHRKNLGEAPNAIIVFDYEIDLDGQTAHLTRRSELDGKELLSDKYGYVETAVKNLDDLTRFVAATDDITYARLQGQGLVLGGRKLKTSGHLSVTVEDIATLWQSEQKLHARLDEFNRRWQQEEEAFHTRWEGRTYHSEAERQRLEREHEEELNALKAQYQAEQANLHLVEGSGFSLDPTYDFERLAQFFAEVEPTLREHAAGAGAPIGSGDIDAAHVGIEKQDAKPLLELIDKMTRSDNPMWVRAGKGFEANVLSPELQFQAARYDGELRGTEVGMTLFYTDLLAKLWSFDFLDSTPAHKIENFQPTPVIVPTLSPVFKKEFWELPGTRLWFGHQDSGFQVADRGNAIVFARNTTRIYAASSDPLQPGKESEPSARSEAFIGWWNDHYEEVAQYEPHYERLNQIMKWSEVLGWLNAANHGELLGFLDENDVKVIRTLWFPEWAKQRKELRFSEWDKVGFNPKNYKGIETETMQLLVSRPYQCFGTTCFQQGGVSLAPKQLFQERQAILPTTEKLLRRSNLDYKLVNSAAKEFKTFGGANYRLTEAVSGRSSLTAIARDGAKLRTPLGELGIGRFERTVFQADAGFTVETSAGGKAIGNLRIDKTSNGFALGWRSRDIDAGQALGRRVSQSADLHQALLADPDVETLIQLADSNHFIVKLRDSHGWLKVAPEEHPSASLAKGWDARVSDPYGGIQNIQLAWAENPQSLVQGFDGDGFIVIDSETGLGKTVLRYEAPRGPPPPGSSPPEETLTFSDKGLNLIGLVKREDRTVRFRWADLKANADHDPFGLATRIARADTKRSPVVSKVDLSRTASTDQPAIVRSLNDGKFHEAAYAIATESDRAAGQLNEYLSQELQIYRTLMAEERYVKASQHIQGLIDTYGHLPDLMLRKGITQLERGHIERAVEALQETYGRPLRDRSAFFDEINARLKNATGSVGDNNLRRLADFAEWQDLQARQILPRVKLVPVADGDRLRLHLHSTQPISGQIASPEDLANIHPKTNTVYIQDTPGLNNLDWNAPLSKSLAELPNGKLPVVLKLNNAPIGHFKPDVVFSPDGATQTHYNLADKSNIAQHLHGNYGGSTQHCNDESTSECKQKQESKPVYIITEPN
jgi:hypothetical protein